jgi:hypothetical protein
MAREVPLRAAGPGGSVAPGPSASALFAAAIASPREARHFVCDVLREWGFGRDARDGAALVTTELAANAVLHADSAFSLFLHARSSVVRIAVHDDLPVDPTCFVVHRRRGLGLVAAVSHDWGVDVTSDGKTVWAEIDATTRG